MNFSEALTAMKLGSKLTRDDWCSEYGENIYVVMQKGYPSGIPINKNTAEATGLPEGTVCKISPYLVKFVGHESTFNKHYMLNPYTPDQLDLFAEDWRIELDT